MRHNIIEYTFLDVSAYKNNSENDTGLKLIWADILRTSQTADRIF
jgi:hypothetical protein